MIAKNNSGNNFPCGWTMLVDPTFRLVSKSAFQMRATRVIMSVLVKYPVAPGLCFRQSGILAWPGGGVLMRLK